MKKWIVVLVMATLFISCGDEDEEDFDPTRLDIVTGLRLRDNLGQVIATWGNPNVSSNTAMAVFPIPANDVIRVQTGSAIQNIWVVSGFPSRRFFDTDFAQVYAENPFQENAVRAAAIRSFDNVGSTNIVLNLSDVSQGYYRLYVQLQNGSILIDNIYVDQSGNPDLTGINFWD